jgi:nucleoside-diphosphate-sugar epimerase
MKILVTEGTGFAGGHLCERLVSSGYSVKALVHDPNRSLELQKLGMELALGDLRDRGSLANAMEGVDLVYNIAAIYRKPNPTRKELWDTNVLGTKNMLEASINAGVKRFVHCSTVGVNGHIKNPPANEETPYAPGDYYQESKVEAEKIVFQYMHEGNISCVICRPCGLYGPKDLRFLQLFKAIKNGVFFMVGSGEVSYHMIYIDDLVDGLLLCGTKQEAIGNVYILGGETPVTLNELVRLIAEVLGVPPPRLRVPFAPVYIASILCEWMSKPFGIEPPLYRRRVDFFRKQRAFDISKAKRELNFQPKTDLKTGIRLTAEWYKNEGLL